MVKARLSAPVCIAALTCAIAGSARGQTNCPGLGTQAIDLTDFPTRSAISDPSPPTARLGPYVYFEAAIPGAGFQVWRTDGTSLGTTVGAIAEGLPPGERKLILGATSDAVVFSSFDVLMSLWVVDESRLARKIGTNQGVNLVAREVINLPHSVVLVADFVSGVARTSGDGEYQFQGLISPRSTEQLANTVVTGGAAFFALREATTGAWRVVKTDGRSARDGGTRTVAFGYDAPAGTMPDSLAAIGTKVYFKGFDGEGGGELWAYDPDEYIASRVLDLRPGADSSNPDILGGAGDMLYFTAANADGVRLLHALNSATGSVTVLSGLAVRALSDDSSPRVFELSGGRALFAAKALDDPSAGLEPYVSDGTMSGTVRLATIAPGSASGSLGTSRALGAVRVGSGAIFFASPTPDVTTPSYELWGTLGTPETTQRLRESSGVNSDTAAISAGSWALFTGNGASAGEAWYTNGTVSGTRSLGVLNPGPVLSNVRAVATGAGVVYFAMDHAGYGRELWSTSGTTASTRIVRDVALGSAGSASLVIKPAGRGVLVGLSAAQRSQYFLWSGARDEPRRALSAAGQSVEVFVGEVNGRLYFQRSDALLGSTPDEQSLRVILDQSPGASVQFSSNSLDTSLATIGGDVLISARSGTSGTELFIVRQGSDAVELVKDINSGTGSSSPLGFTKFGNRVLFFANTPEAGLEPYVTDGTAAGTVMLADANAGPAPSVTITGLHGDKPVVVVGSASSPVGYIVTRAVASATPPIAAKLFRTDGTPAGTYAVNVGSLPVSISWLSAGEGEEVLLIEGPRVWAVGEPSGPRLVAEVTVPATSGTPSVQWARQAAGRVYMGVQLSTRFGTMSAGIYAASAGSTVAQPVPLAGVFRGLPPSMTPGPVIGERMAVTAHMSGNQSAVLIVGPTEACVLDSLTGAQQIELVNSRLFVTADDGVIGLEPRTLDLCPADFNNSGGEPTVQDVLDFLTAFFAGEARADVNGSGGMPTAQDVFDYLAQWFAGCA